MQRRIVIYMLVTLIVSSCSVLRKKESTVVNDKNSISESEGYIREMQENNLCRKSFIIKKGSISINSKSLGGDFDVVGKVKNNKEFYFSVRGLLGIEVMRIISANDSLYIINRIERRIYYAGIDEYTRRIGLPADIVGTVFGDLPEGLDGYAFERKSDGLRLNYNTDDYESVFWLCSSQKKICSSMIRLKSNMVFYDLEYSDFEKTTNAVYPKKIQMQSQGAGIKIELTIDELEVAVIDKIQQYLPGYKRIKL